MTRTPLRRQEIGSTQRAAGGAHEVAVRRPAVAREARADDGERVLARVDPEVGDDEREQRDRFGPGPDRQELVLGALVVAPAGVARDVDDDAPPVRAVATAAAARAGRPGPGRAARSAPGARAARAAAAARPGRCRS